MAEELRKVIQRLVRLETLYAAIAGFESYYSTKAEGDTQHYLITPDSQPIFTLHPEENEALGFMKAIPKESVIHKKTLIGKRYTTPYYEGGYIIYIATQPFKVWVRHRGYTGNRSDSYDKIVDCDKVENLEQLRTLLKRVNIEI